MRLSISGVIILGLMYPTSALSAQSVMMTATIPAKFEPGVPGYIPLPGSTVTVENTCPATTEIKYPSAFPDITSRFALAKLSANGQVSYGPISVTAKYEQYIASVDYASTDIVSVKIWIKPTGALEFTATRDSPVNLFGYTEYNVPVLIGVGLRLTAQFVISEGNAQVSGLSVIGASAAASKLRGTMMVESVGVTGETLAASIPLPSKLDQTTVENAILALGAGRTAMYSSIDQKKVSVQPRVVGMLSPGSNPYLVNAIQTEIISKPIPWKRPCTSL